MTMPPVHLAAAIFPLMGDADLRALADDIAANGQREPIILYRGQLLDGRNRWRACELIGKRPRIENHDNLADPVAFAASMNLRRRHLDESQRAMVAERLRRSLTGKSAPDDEEGVFSFVVPTEAPTGRVRDRVAEAMTVSSRLVDDARTVQSKGAPELIARVDAGEIAVSAAADIALLPLGRQREIAMAVDPRVIRQIARDLRSKKAERREGDAYLSAAGFVRPLLALLRPTTNKGATIIECCSGAGDLVQPLLDSDFVVHTNDLDPSVAADSHDDATDAATWAKTPPADWVVSNLPFNSAIRILPHALAHASVGVAVILRLSFLEPVVERRDFLARHPLTNMIVLPRYSFTGDGNTDSVTCAWCIWERGSPSAIFIPLPDAEGMPSADLEIS